MIASDSFLALFGFPSLMEVASASVGVSLPDPRQTLNFK
jgi:hypothetical protein